MKKIISILLLNLIVFTQNINLKYYKTDVDNYTNCVLAVQVYDVNRQPIKDLNENNFMAKVDNKDFIVYKVSTYKKSNIPMNFALCVDISGSMSGKPLEYLKNAVIKFIDEMRYVDKLSIVIFENDAKLLCDFSNNKEYLKELVRNLKASGNNTALYYGIYKGLNQLIENKDKAGKILIVISDGKDENPASSYTLEDNINKVKENGIPIFSIG